MKATGIMQRMIINSRRAAMTLLLAMTALTAAWAQNVDPKSIPLTLEAINGTIITVTNPKSGMQYSINGGDKTVLTTENNQIQVSAGQKVQFYGNGTNIKTYNRTKIRCSNDCYIYGNIMSLVDETGFAINTTLTELP